MENSVQEGQEELDLLFSGIISSSSSLLRPDPLSFWHAESSVLCKSLKPLCPRELAV